MFMTLYDRAWHHTVIRWCVYKNRCTTGTSLHFRKGRYLNALHIHI